MNWESNRYGDLEAITPEGKFWIGDASSSRSGKFEVWFYYTKPDGTTVGEELGRTRTQESAKKLCLKRVKKS
jgi:hypothetical protein